MQTFTINFRPRRQTTIPKTLLDELNVGIGDDFNAHVEGNKLIFKPKKQIAMDAFKELQKAIQESGIGEKEMQENLTKIRQEEYENSHSIH